MKNAIREYIDLTKQEKEELWSKATFVFDTNIFLNLYRYTADTRESLLKAMCKLGKRIWMPKQVAQELMKDRPKVILDTSKIFTEINAEKEKFIKSCAEKLRREYKEEKFENLSKEIDKYILEFKNESQFIDEISKDKILKQLLDCFDGKVGEGFTQEELEEIKKQGKVRYEKQIPPGYKDYGKGENNSFGDLIIWKEIINFSKENDKDIIFVTGDQKEDWWYRVGEKTLGPRIELRKEFFENTNKLFHMYNMKGFLEQTKNTHGVKIEQKVIDEVETYQQKKERILSEFDKMYHNFVEKEKIEKNIEQLNADLGRIEQRKIDIKKYISLDEEKTNKEIEMLRKGRSNLNNLYQCINDMEFKENMLKDTLEKENELRKQLKRLKHYRNHLINLNDNENFDGEND